MTVMGSLRMKDGKVIEVPWGQQDQPWVPCLPFGPDCHPQYQAVTAWGALPSYPLFMCKLTQGDHEIANSVTYASNAYAWLGLKWGYFGMYHWLEHNVPMQIQLQTFQAAIIKVISVTRAASGLAAFPPGVMWMLDWERTPNEPDPTYLMAEQFIAGMEKWVKDSGIVYAADWLPDFVTWRNRNPTYPLWYANYNTHVDNPRGGVALCTTYRADMWQWADSFVHPSGMINPGLPSMDMNMPLNYNTLNRICGYTFASYPPTIPPTIPPSPVKDNDIMAGYTNAEAALDPTGATGQSGQNPDGTWPPAFIQWASVFDNVKWCKMHMGATEYDGRATIGKTNVQLATIPDFAGMIFPPAPPVVFPDNLVLDGQFQGGSIHGHLSVGT